MGVWSESCSAGRRLFTMRLQCNSWTFISPFPPRVEQVVPQHGLWTMRRHSCQYTVQPSTFWPAQQRPRSVVRPPACSPRLQPSSVPVAFHHTPRDAAVAVGDVSNRQSTNAATVGPPRQSAVQQQLYTSPAAYRRSRQTSSSASAAQPKQSVSNSQYVAALSAVPRQHHQQQQLGIQTPPSSTGGSERHVSNSNINHSQRSARSRRSSSSLSPAQHMARNRTTTTSSSSSNSLPSPNRSSSSTTSFSVPAAAAEASCNSYSGSSGRHVAMSNMVPQQQLGIHAPTTSSSSSSWGSHANSSTHHQQHSSRSRSSSFSLSPAQHMARKRRTRSLPLSGISSSTSSSTSSNTFGGDAAAGSSGAVLQQQQQQQRDVMRHTSHQRTRSESASQSPFLQQQQQQQYIQSSSGDSGDWLPYLPPPIPPKLLQPPPAGPLHLDVTAMLSWTDGSPPGLDKFASRKLPAYLDHRRLIWVSAYQPGGPGTSAAIWVGQTWLGETLDSSISDHAGSDQAGSDHAGADQAGSGRQQQTLDGSLSDQISNAATGVRGVLLSSDLIRSESVAADVADQQQLRLTAPLQQQQQQDTESEHSPDDAELTEQLGNFQRQQLRRQRQQQLQPPIPPVMRQQSAAAGRLWLEVAQRPDVGLAPAAVVEGLTFARHSRMSADSSSSSSSNGGSISDDSLGPSEEVQQRVNRAAAVVAAFACSEVTQETVTTEHRPWYDYLLLVSGDFSVIDHENMFPNTLVHCSDGRVRYNARSAADIAAFVAEAEESKMHAHIRNLLGYVWAQPDNFGTGWVVDRLRDRWGVDAMIRFGVDWPYLNARLAECGGR